MPAKKLDSAKKTDSVKDIVKRGDKIKVDYTGTLDNGQVFDSSTHGDHSHPLEFIVGSGEIIPGFDNAVLGMKKGEEKEIILPKEQAYGDPNPALIKKVPRTNLPLGQEPKSGMLLMLKTPEGHQIPAKIDHVTDTDIFIDLNHPLAGKTLHFKIKLVDIENITKE